MKTDGSDVRLVSTGCGRTHVRLLLPRRPAADLRLHSSRRRCSPAPARSLQRLRVADLSCLRDRLGRRRRRQHPRVSRITTATTRRAPCRPTAAHRASPKSLREGDLDLYVMNADGSGVTRLTDRLGYDGGALLLLGRPLHRLSGPPIPTRPPSATSTWRCSGRSWCGRGELEVFVMRAGRHRRAPGHASGRGELCAVHASQRPADHLLVELRRPDRPRLRPLS